MVYYFSIYIVPNLKQEYGDVCRGQQKKVRKSAPSTRLLVINELPFFNIFPCLSKSISTGHILHKLYKRTFPVCCVSLAKHLYASNSQYDREVNPHQNPQVGHFFQVGGGVLDGSWVDDVLTFSFSGNKQSVSLAAPFCNPEQYDKSKSLSPGQLSINW